MSKAEEKKEEEVVSEEEEIPEHFYDSDMASVNPQDFESDSEPPKDTPLERKRIIK